MKRLIAAGMGAAAMFVFGACSNANQQWHRDCLAQAKDVLYTSVDGTSSRTKRLTTSCGAFNVSDSLAGGFDSWDTWQRVEIGQRYDLRTGGYRIGFFDEFPVVLEAKSIQGVSAK